MRILITNKGEATVRELDEMADRNYKTTKNRFKRRNLSLKQDDSFLEKGRRTPQQEFCRTFRPNTKFIDIEKRLLTKEEIRRNAVPIKINVKKLAFPKHIVDQYETDKEDKKHPRKSIIMEEQNMPPITLPNVNINENMDSRLALKEILPSTTVYNIKKKLCFEKKMTDKLSRIDETKFRSSYQKKTELEQLNQILKYRKIPPSKMNLISYLNKKEDISNYSIQKLITSTDAEISKSNKICQIVFYNETQNKVLKEIIKAKINHNHIQEKITCENDMKDMKNNIAVIKNTIDKYERKVNKMEKYREAHTDIIKHHWNKYNFEALQKKKKLVDGKLVTKQKIIIEDM